MLEQLLQQETWEAFLAYKCDNRLLTRQEEARLRTFVESRAYLPAAQRMQSESFCFSVPEKRELNKMGSAKKRIVYLFPEPENTILKLLSYLLYRYDEALPDTCYAFRRNIGARRAFTDVAFSPQIDALYGFKADVRNYFNSIDVQLLEPILRDVIADDPPLLSLLLRLLRDDRAVWQGQVIREPRGVMAGTPIAPFFANLYLREMDAYFASQGVLYARYSDDMILFDTAARLPQHIERYRAFLAQYHLSSNPDKERQFAPGEPWDFLGFSYTNGVIDISDAAIRKIMGKARRAARSVRRWMLKNGVDADKGLYVFNRKFNRKFYESASGSELCWTRWYFPLINTTDSLHRIDLYLQQCQRYLVTGRHNKAGYAAVPYDRMRRCGYRPLVAAYYDRREKNE